MFDIERYKRFKGLEDKVFRKLGFGSEYRGFSLRKLIRRVQEVSTSLSEDVAPLVREIGEARSLRSITMSSYTTTKAKIRHLAVIGALAYIGARLHADVATDAVTALPSREDVLSHLQNIVPFDLTHRSYVWVATAVSRHIRQRHSTVSEAVIQPLTGFLSAHLQCRGRSYDLDLVGFLALTIDLLRQTPAPREDGADQGPVVDLEDDSLQHRGSDVPKQLDANTLEELERAAFYSELSRHVALIEGTWASMTIERVAGVVAVCQGLWRQLRSLVNSMSEINPILLSKVPPDFQLSDELATTDWMCSQVPDPHHHRHRRHYESMFLFNRWMTCAEQDSAHGMFFDTLSDCRRETPSWRFGLALLLYLEKKWAGPTRSELNAAIQYKAGYLLLILGSIPEAYKGGELETVKSKLSRYRAISLEADAFGWCYLSARISGLMERECRKIMTYPPNTAFAHLWVWARMRSICPFDGEVSQRVDTHLAAHEKLLFFDGQPATMKAFKRSVTNYLIYKSDKDRDRATIVSAMREERHLDSLFQAIDEGDYSSFEFPDDAEQCRALVTEFVAAEAVIPDVLGIHKHFNLEAATHILRDRSLEGVTDVLSDLLKSVSLDAGAAMSYFEQHCWFCDAKGAKERCDECQWCRYCSQECRTRDRSGHLAHFHKRREGRGDKVARPNT